LKILEKGRMSKRNRKSDKVEVVPAAWLDASEFAEVTNQTNQGNIQVFLSGGLDTSTKSVKGRLSRLVGNLTNREIIGDVEPELALDVA